MNSQDAGLYAFSILVLFGAWVLIRSTIEGLKKKYHWRWGIILLMALYSFIKFGADTNTFDFMWQKTKEFIQSPPWREKTTQITDTNDMAKSHKLQGYNFDARVRASRQN